MNLQPSIINPSLSDQCDVAGSTPSHSAIAMYYDCTKHYYWMFWHGSTGAIHYGLRDARTRSAKDELLNTNRVMAERARISHNDRVLDAGCGIGGSSFWLARERGARVVGITLSRVQLRQARRTADRLGMSEQVGFHLRDYSDTRFATGSFDVVWALESSCYAADKAAFVREAHRILRPGGRIVVGDGFLLRPPANESEQRHYDLFKRGLMLPDMVQPQALAEVLRANGFSEVRVWDETEGAIPSCQRLYRRCAAALPIARALGALGLVSPILLANIRAGIAQRHLVKAGVAGYFVLFGERDCARS